LGAWEAVKAAIISIPKLIGLVEGLLARFDRLAQAIEDRKVEEQRNEQRFATIQTLKLQVDADRAEMARRLSSLEQRR
jgi:hypothetical protein